MGYLLAGQSGVTLTSAQMHVVSVDATVLKTLCFYGDDSLISFN
ncbi:uncharacterized protein J3R85_000482 [Psidium guajava]|nr:uncharacterized protein J3R85_000482 [Psidium guajava]